jgi:hypothetical protein
VLRERKVSICEPSQKEKKNQNLDIRGVSIVTEGAHFSLYEHLVTFS